MQAMHFDAQSELNMPHPINLPARSPHRATVGKLVGLACRGCHLPTHALVSWNLKHRQPAVAWLLRLNIFPVLENPNAGQGREDIDLVFCSYFWGEAAHTSLESWDAASLYRGMLHRSLPDHGVQWATVLPTRATVVGSDRRKVLSLPALTAHSC